MFSTLYSVKICSEFHHSEILFALVQRENTERPYTQSADDTKTDGRKKERTKSRLYTTNPHGGGYGKSCVRHESGVSRGGSATGTKVAQNLTASRNPV